MRIVERDAEQRFLTQIYLPQESGRVMPSEVADEILLVHPAQPFSAQFVKREIGMFQGALGATTLGLGGPGAGGYIWVLAFSATHNDPAARDLQLELRELSSGTTVVLIQAAGLSSVTPLALHRSMVVPFNTELHVTASGMAAGQRITARVVQIRYLDAEIPPWI